MQAVKLLPHLTKNLERPRLPLARLIFPARLSLIMLDITPGTSRSLGIHHALREVRPSIHVDKVSMRTALFHDIFVTISSTRVVESLVHSFHHPIGTELLEF